MKTQGLEQAANIVTFGRRKVRPRVCIADGKKHIRSFLIDAFEDLEFVTCECGNAPELGTLLDAQRPDLVVFGLSAGGIDAAEMLKTLAAKAFDGKLLLLGPPKSPVTEAIQELAEELEIATLPQLGTPFGEMSLRKVSPRCSPTKRRQTLLSFLMKLCTRGGSNYGISRKSTRARSH
jgi:CheY-like chemotaxis protein